MSTLAQIAPGAAALAAAGGITILDRSAKCELCGEWTDGQPAVLRSWGRQHAFKTHDASRPSVLGLDTSLTRAGIAITSLDRPLGDRSALAWPTVLTHRGEAGSKDATYDERGRRLVRQAKAIMGVVDEARRLGADIRLAVIEGPSYGQSSMPSYYDRAGLWWAVVTALQARAVPFAVVTPDHRAKFICGVKPPMGKDRDRAKKLIVDETRARWNYPDGPELVREFIPRRMNHDQADALGLADMGVVKLGWPTPWQKRRRHVENVHLTTWPKVVV
ncbi:RuvC-like resolvase [Mycobacterium phage Weirdo19]|uniref:RuvC-like resolvase n=1 Tax=Mycobacterium phage Weirdo19 TaxID=2601610 RepID=A0A6M2YSW6_9CAUD|nr:RuvC-like Holliday junction resolvase [Mycobacterium phage Weirdo19]QEA10834.1 RuvC-like resolvase [Mycobacterium phage Weirdo19]